MNIRNPIHTFFFGAAAMAVLVAILLLSFDRYNPLKDNPLLDSNQVLKDSINVKEGELKVIRAQNEEQAKQLSDSTELVDARSEVARLKRRLQLVRNIKAPAFTSGNPAYKYLKERAKR